MRQTSEVVEQEWDPVAGLEGVKSTLEDGKGNKLTLQLKSFVRHAISVFRYNFETNCTKQVGAKGHWMFPLVSGTSVLGCWVMMGG
jgi:hypothetical protein